MASEHVLEVLVRRHVFDTDRPFPAVLAGIFGGISQPDIGQLFSELAASISYEQFSSLVRQAQGSAGLMRFLQLDLDQALTLDPQAPHWAGRRLVRLIAGNPVTMGQMTRHVADAGSYAPVTILIQQLPDGRTRVAYDTVASAIAPYHDAAAAEVAELLDAEVLELLRQATGEPASAPPERRAAPLIHARPRRQGADLMSQVNMHEAGASARNSRQRWYALLVCMAGGFIVFPDVSIVNVALPTISAQLHASGSLLQWIVSGYSLAFGLVLVPDSR